MKRLGPTSNFGGRVSKKRRVVENASLADKEVSGAVLGDALDDKGLLEDIDG